MPDMATTMNFFRDRGFDATGLYVVGRDKHLRAIDFDCVMVNSRLLTAHPEKEAP
jgi:hypothetical protein